MQFRLYRTYRVFSQFPTAGPVLQLYWYHGTWSYSKSSSRTLPRLYGWDFCLASGCLHLLTSFKSPDLFLWKNRLKDWAQHEFLGCYFWNDSLKKTFFLHPFFLACFVPGLLSIYRSNWTDVQNDRYCSKRRTYWKYKDRQSYLWFDYQLFWAQIWILSVLNFSETAEVLVWLLGRNCRFGQTCCSELSLNYRIDHCLWKNCFCPARTSSFSMSSMDILFMVVNSRLFSLFWDSCKTRIAWLFASMKLRCWLNFKVSRPFFFRYFLVFRRADLFSLVLFEPAYLSELEWCLQNRLLRRVWIRIFCF